MAKTKEDNKTVQGITREAMWKKYDELKLKNFTNESLIKVAKACNMKANSKKQMQRMRGFLVTMVQSMEANKENNKKSAERANRNEASEESDESEEMESDNEAVAVEKKSQNDGKKGKAAKK